jgi:hypothetical protein
MLRLLRDIQSCMWDVILSEKLNKNRLDSEIQMSDLRPANVINRIHSTRYHTNRLTLRF